MTIFVVYKALMVSIGLELNQYNGELWISLELSGIL